MLWEVLARVPWGIEVLRGVLPRVLKQIGGAPASAPEGAQCVRSFEKGLAGRGGWREEILPMPEIQAPFLCPFSYATLRRRGTQL